MRSEAIDKFNDQVIKKALAQIDQDTMAQALKQKIEKALTEGFDSVLENGFDFEYWLQEELTNEKTKSGKAFKKAVESMTLKMAEALQG